jgi:hypothetical protein
MRCGVHVETSTAARAAGNAMRIWHVPAARCRRPCGSACALTRAARQAAATGEALLDDELRRLARRNPARFGRLNLRLQARRALERSLARRPPHAHDGKCDVQTSACRPRAAASLLLPAGAAERRARRRRAPRGGLGRIRGERDRGQRGQPRPARALRDKRRVVRLGGRRPRARGRQVRGGARGGAPACGELPSEPEPCARSAGAHDRGSSR